MCVATCGYVLSLFLETFSGIGKEYSSMLSKFSWISATMSFIFYLFAIEAFLISKSRLLQVARIFLILIVGCWIIVFNTELIYEEQFSGYHKTSLSEALNVNHEMTNFGKLLGLFALFCVYIACAGILYKLIKAEKKDKWLILGVLLTLVCATHDAILGSIAGFSSIPLYYLGNFFEAIRFTEYYRSRVDAELRKLEKENWYNKGLLEEGVTSKKLLRLLSHDINNGITIAKHGVRVASRSLEDDNKEQLAKSLAKIERGINNIVEISGVVRMVEASRSGMLNLEISAVPINEAIEEVIQNHEEQLAKKELTIEFKRSQKNMSVLAEPVSLKNEVLGNLVSNAIKFSHPKGKIYISLREDIDSTYVEVADKGVGIPDELIDVLFDNDSQTTRPGTGGEQGSGFGMPLMKSFVENYGGSVSVVSSTEAESAGTKFIVKLKSSLS